MGYIEDHEDDLVGGINVGLPFPQPDNACLPMTQKLMNATKIVPIHLLTSSAPIRTTMTLPFKGQQNSIK